MSILLKIDSTCVCHCMTCGHLFDWPTSCEYVINLIISHPTSSEASSAYKDIGESVIGSSVTVYLGQVPVNIYIAQYLVFH